jgi:hypothetical protein
MTVSLEGAERQFLPSLEAPFAARRALALAGSRLAMADGAALIRLTVGFGLDAS